MSHNEEKKESSEGEDIPSDFFDDFSKAEFMEVIDSWKNEETQDSRARIDEKAVNSVNDLRELIAKEDRSQGSRSRRNSPHHYEPDMNLLDDYIRPGSRRDPNKTKKAIKKDKEVKVKELLAKHLESMDDIRPPGTELDDYFDESRNSEKKKYVEEFARKHVLVEKEGKYELSPPNNFTEQTAKRRRDSPKRRCESPSKKRRESPLRNWRNSALKYRRESPRYRRESPSFHCDVSPRRRDGREVYSRRGQFRHRSPNFNPRRPAHNSHWSPRRSPHQNRRYRQSPLTRRERRSRSPYSRYKSRSRSHSVNRGSNEYVYPETYVHPSPELFQVEQQYMQPVNNEYAPSYQYPQGASYPNYTETYYPPQPDPMTVQNMPKPVSAPNPVIAPSMVPAPSQTSPVMPDNPVLQNLGRSPVTPYDALAKLVADGKLSHEDYLKLAPNKGATSNMDPKERVAVLNRCNVAMNHLSKLMLPNRLLISNNYIGQEQKAITSKFCSPLKRQTAVEFHFLKTNELSISQRNKQIIDSIISTLVLDKIVSRPKKKVQKDMTNASVQTSIPVCEVCEIRESTRFCDASTSIDPEYFSSTVHTQVIEEDLYSSKSIFNPSGSSSSGAPISIAHLTPAQLVSQLAARAKTLKQADLPQSAGNRPNFNYDYSRGGNQYQNYNNYRY